MDNEIPTLNLTVVAQPTVKEQFVQAGVGLGIAAAVTLVTFGALIVVGNVAEKITDRRIAKKALAKTEQ